jgi:hypothetical protein
MRRKGNEKYFKALCCRTSVSQTFLSRVTLNQPTFFILFGKGKFRFLGIENFDGFKTKFGRHKVWESLTVGCSMVPWKKSTWKVPKFKLKLRE